MTKSEELFDELQKLASDPDPRAINAHLAVLLAKAIVLLVSQEERIASLEECLEKHRIF